MAPWSNWNTYRNWVESTVLAVNAAGYDVSYWEVYNEPHLLSAYYTPSVYATVTPQRLLQQFLVAYQAIKAVDQSAQVIGPSLAHYGSSWSPRAFGMDDFLKFAASNGIQLAAVSWHLDDNQPNRLPGEAAQVRSEMASLPTLGSPRIFINEYGTAGLQRIPGWDIAYLAALNAAGVDQANRSCWDSDCAQPDLDGLSPRTVAAPCPTTGYGRPMGRRAGSG